MLRTRFTAPAALVLAVGLLVGCSSSGGTSASNPTTRATVPAASPSAKAATSAAAAGGAAPSPNAAQSVALIAAFRAVDPGLVTDESQALSNAAKTCVDIKGGKSDTQIAANVKARFESTGTSALSTTQIQAIVVSVKTAFCS